MKRQLAQLVLLALTFHSCGSRLENSQNFKVEYKGALKTIMQQGDLSAQANLRDFENTKNLYALGALENLKGEITILNSEPYLSTVNGGDLVIHHSFDYGAALLVYTAVENWGSFPLPEEVSTYAGLEKQIEETAKAIGIDTAEPFPFLLEGTANALDWHVIDWPAGDSVHTHEKHQTIGPHGTLNEREVQILGFYSSSHHGVFTHHSTNMHLHVITSDEGFSAHVDDFSPGRGMVLKLPDVR